MEKLQALANGMHAVFRERVAMLAKWRGLLIFNYHRIGNPAEQQFDRALFSATQDDFARQVVFLKRHFNLIGPADLDAAKQDRRGRHVLITFDDGYCDNYELAFPVLKAEGACATFFVTTGFLDGGGLAWWDEIAWMIRHAERERLEVSEWLPEELTLAPPSGEAAIRVLLSIYKRLPAAACPRFMAWLAQASGAGRCTAEVSRRFWMNWEMVRDMRGAGMSIGGHTVNHPVMANLGLADQAHEVQGTAARLKEELDETMRWFAYPVGGRQAFNNDSRQVLREAGVEYAFSYYGGFNRPGQWDNYDMRRVSVSHRDDMARFRALTCLPDLYSMPDVPLTTRVRQTLSDVI